MSHIVRKTRMLLAIIIMMSLAMPGHAQYSVKRDSNVRTEIKNYTAEQLREIYGHRSPLGITYTKRHPLVVVSAWAFPPYSYINDQGEPDGLFLELMQSIFHQFYVANEIRMVDRTMARRLFMEGKAQLLVDVENIERPADVKCSSIPVLEFMVSVLCKRDTKLLGSFTMLDSTSVAAVNWDDYTYSYIRTHYKGAMPQNIIPVRINTIVNDLLGDKVNYVLGRTAMLRNIVKRYGIENEVEIRPIDIPNGRFRFFSRDTVLLHEIDMRMQNMERTGQLQSMRDRWQSGNGAIKPPSKRNEVVAVTVLVLVLVVMTIVYFVIHRTSVHRGLKREFREITSMGLSLSNSRVAVISKPRNKVYGIIGDMVPSRGIAIEEYFKMIHPDDLATHSEVMSKVDSGAVVMPTVHMRLRPYGDTTGRWRNMSINSRIKTDSKGRPLHIFLTFVDETEHLKAREALDKVTREHKTVMDLSDVCMAYYDQSGTLISFNSACADFFCQTYKERGLDYINGKSLRELCVLLNGMVLEKEMDVWLCAPIDILELGIKTVIEVRIRTIWDSNHQNQGYTVTFQSLDDVLSTRDELAEADKQLAYVQRSLQMFQSDLRFIMRRHNIRMFRYDVATDSLSLSENGQSFTDRISLQTYLGRMRGDETEVEHARKLFTTMNGDEEHPLHTVHQVAGVGNNEPDIWYDITMRPETDGEGNFIGYVGIRCDITDYMSNRTRLDEETEKAGDAGRQKAEFMREMTHELRTPLNIINGFAEIMSFLTTDEEKKQYLDIMNHSCLMLLSLVDNILQLSIIDTVGIKLRVREVDFARMFREKAEELRMLITEPGVKYRIDSPQHTLMVKVDAERVLQVFDAFVNNASKYTKEGFIHVGFRCSQQVLTVYCRDTGCGIPLDKQKEVFKRFVKIDNFTEGMGLGLAVCQKLAELMGGSVDLYSRVGEGTVVSLNINIQK